MTVRFQRKHHPRERVAGHRNKRSSHAASGFARWRTGVSKAIPVAAVNRWLARIPCGNSLVRSLAVLGLVASSAGCILTQDIPYPALDVPGGYKTARLTAATDAPPPLDCRRGFRSPELTQLREEAQTVTLDSAADTP